MNRILAALILSTAAIGAAQAGEIGYLDNPGQNTQATFTRAQVQNDLNAHRAEVDAFQGQLNPARTVVRAGTESRAQVAQEQGRLIAKGPAGATFVNG